MNCEGLRRKLVYYHFLLALPNLSALKGGVLDPAENKAILEFQFQTTFSMLFPHCRVQAPAILSLAF
jgi:hypothetical protein